MTIPITSISFGKRARSDYDGIEELAHSIRDRGLIQPIVVNQSSDGTYLLVAGGRRYRAIEYLNIRELHHNQSSVPGQAGFVLLSDLRPDELIEIELEENLFRQDLKWQDRALLVDQIHTAKKTLSILNHDKPWGERQTGELLSCSKGDINNCRTIAAELRKNPKPFANCTSVSDAVRVILMRRNDEAIKHQLRNNKAPTSITSISEFFDDDEDSPPPQTYPSTSSSPQPGPVADGPTKVYLSRQFVHGDCLALMDTIADETFHHIVCDPPYGIDLDFMDLKNQDRVEATHEVEANIELIEMFIYKSYRLLKPNGFLVMFYDLDHHDKILGWAAEIGFKPQRWPIVWVKEHPCKNQAASYNFTKNVEFAFVMRKGNATLIKPQLSCVISAEGSVEKKMYDNPFAKPFAVWKFIYDAIATKGQTVFDPFMGEGSACRAAVNLGLTPYGCELDDHHYNKAILGVKETYKLLLGETVEFR